MKYEIVLDGIKLMDLGRPIQQRDIQLVRDEYQAIYCGTTLIEKPRGLGREETTTYIFEKIKGK